MRTAEEIQGNIDLMEAYLKQAEARLLSAYDSVEMISDFAAVKELRDRIGMLRWVLNDPQSNPS